MIREDLLQFIWKHQLFEKTGLTSTEGEIIQVLSPGIHNYDSGPDFLQAKIKIGETLWAGNVEIHVKSSDWFLHGHVSDPAYQNIILHVVYENKPDENQFRKLNAPVLELQNRIQEKLISHYQSMMKSGLWIPCESSIMQVDGLTKVSWTDRLMIERLEKREQSILQLLEKNRNDWQESFYQFVARSFGFRVNSEAMEELAFRTPLKLISWYKNNLTRIEALLFGQSGLINQGLRETYPRELLKEYEFLKSKHNLKPLSARIWKFSKLRPYNFPTVRIAQLASLLYHSSALFSKLMEVQSKEDLINYFNISASDYWNNHFRFDKESTIRSIKKLQSASVNGILINTVIPFLFVYGKLKMHEDKKERAIALLGKLPPENNSILKKWIELGMTNSNAGESQALIQLKQEYCKYKRCLNCGIGVSILKKGSLNYNQLFSR